MKTSFFFLITLILSFNIIAADDNSMPVKDPFAKETELAVSRIKEQEVEKQIMESSELLKGCKEKDTLTEKEDCIKEKVTNMDDGEVEKLSKNLDLESFDKQASKSATTIKDYLSKRIETALRGAPKDKSVKEMNIKDLKFVDHAVYATLYRSQIGKNILLEVSNYCLANFGIKGQPNQLINQCMVSTGGTCTKADYEVMIKGQKTPINLAAQTVQVGWDPVNNKEDLSLEKLVGSTTSTSASFWSTKAFEYSSCDETTVNGNSSSNCNRKVSKATGLLDKIKEVEFSLGGEYLKDKVGFCSMVVVKNMCELYRCRHVYSKNTDTIDPKTNKGKNETFCNDELGITISQTKPPKILTENTFDPSTGNIVKDVSGIKACGLVERLKEYRRVIAALDEIDKFNKENKGKGKGLSLEASKAFKGQYNRGASSDEKSIEEITTISSKEFAEVDFNDTKKIDELKEKCFQGGVLSQEKDCQELSANLLDSKKSENIQAEMEAETEVYLKRVQQLADANDKESLNEYLKKNGLEKYIDSGLTEQELANLISDQYTSERAALKASMMEKFKALTQPAPNAQNPNANNDTQILNAAEETIANMEQQKEKIKTLVQYNNIITSYMGASIGEGKDKKDTELTYQREIEMENLEKSKDDNDVKDVTAYKEYFQDSSQGQTGSASTNLQVDLNFIDALLGTAEDKPQTP